MPEIVQSTPPSKMMLYVHKILHSLEVVLRVPPLFVIDEIFKNMGTASPIDISLDLAEESNRNILDYHVIIVALVKFVCGSLGCILAVCVFVLWKKNLVKVYRHIGSVLIIFALYWANVTFAESILSLDSSVNPQKSRGLDVLRLDTFGLNRFFGFDKFYLSKNIVYWYPILQGVLTTLFYTVFQGPRPPFLLLVMYIAPIVLTLSPLPVTITAHTPFLCAIIPLLLIKYVIWVNVMPATQALYSGYRHVHTMLSNFGMATFVEAEWTRLNVPSVLLTFWLMRVSGHAGLLTKEYLQSGVATPLPELLPQMAKALLVGGCDTLIAVLGMTSVVSYLCYYLGCLFQWALLAEGDEEKPIGTVSGLLFYVLALQAGLTSCDPDKRLVRLSRNICLLFTALLHFVHNYVHPLLLSLSASHNPALHRHLRALGVAVFIIVFPVSLLIFLWSHHELSTWLLAVSTFSVEVIVKVIVSLMIYSLFLLDAYRSTFWEKLDDYVYYIQAFGHVVEFSFGILLFMNSAWVLVFEAGGAVRAVMVGIHVYFNIWCDAQAGWRVFMKRRTAVNKINSLPEASPQQLQALNDVCSICYSEMVSAKITRCNHFFHGVCLRKWLYVQDRCPLCHDILYRVPSQELLSQ
ncbi:Protein TRC8-like protein [Frankliniella fusca]|uniref:Protein TRC8-like protein n=1 Tax=Frankliniella fusca TaxID=407009 RepID=A0AAE1LGP9_9NEOP|nr:Protein TRC8-like protein [Frankliniella fusca]